MTKLSLDTNILLLDANNLLTLGKNNVIVLAETVLEEMDSKKSLMNELGYQAREFGRILARSTIVSMDKGDTITTTLSVDGITIKVIALSNYKAIRGDSYNDQKIIEATIAAEAAFMSNDVMCRLRGLAAGLEVMDFKAVEEADLEFTRECVIEDVEVFRTLHNTHVLDVISDHKPENFNYKFSNPLTGQVKLATIDRHVINVLGKESEKELRRQDINPANCEQLLFSKALQDPLVDVVVCESLAGSGKTLVALSNAIKLVKHHKYDNILYVRASVNDVDDIEEVGFLPGLDEKFAVYLHPMHDSLDAIVRGRHKASKLKGAELEEKIEAEITKLVADCSIEATTTLGMRGRTYNNTIIIIDEVQNQSKGSLVKVMTRVGKNCKLVLLGSNRQIDNSYMTKYTNGLSVILDACTKEQDVLTIYAVTLQKVVRGVIAEWSERLFSK